MVFLCKYVLTIDMNKMNNVDLLFQIPRILKGNQTNREYICLHAHRTENDLLFCLC